MAIGTSFHGREKEFAWLRGMFDAVATKGPDGKFTGPRMAVIVAESGIGKSRIVQELYIRLTNDPHWDPPEVDYWPEAFGDGGVSLDVKPDMSKHEAKGPPRFLWLGARWSDPDDRNVVHSNALPSIGSELRAHAEIFDRNRSVWDSLAKRPLERVLREIGDEFVAEAVGRGIELLAGQSFLGVGLGIKLTKAAAKTVKERRQGPQAFEQVEERQEKSLVDELIDSFRLLLDAGDSVPAVLWLDDAQWMDKEARAFVHKLWKEAERRKWPLLIVATHWEREWRELAQARRKADAAPSLVDFEGQPSVETLHLANAANGALRDYLAQRLSGLTAEQQRLLVDKAGGNFLAMVENAGELLSEPMWFVSERVDGALTGEAVGHIVEFETDRERRVEQRFKALETEVKQILGWSAEMGSRFLAKTVVEFAQERSTSARPNEALAKCVDPYALVAKPLPEVCEFRDPAYHRVASFYSARFLQPDRPAFLEFMRRQFVASLEAVSIDDELPQVLVLEQSRSFHQRVRHYPNLNKRSVASLQRFAASESWRSHRARFVITDNLRDEVVFAARHLRTVSQGGSALEARTTIAVKCWLLAEGHRQADGQAKAWLSMLESTDWTDEIVAPIPAKLLWYWSAAVPVSLDCAEAMRSAALKKWRSRSDELGDLSAASGHFEMLVNELTECSRLTFDSLEYPLGDRENRHLAELTIQLADSISDGAMTNSIRQCVSHHALVLAVARLHAEPRVEFDSTGELSSKIDLPTGARDVWYDARWAVWLRLQVEVADRADVANLTERLSRAIDAQLGVPEAQRDLNDLMALSQCVLGCRDLIDGRARLYFEYQIAEFKWETSVAIEKWGTAIKIARLHESESEVQLASDWWQIAFAHWVESATEGDHWHSYDCFFFISNVRDCCARVLSDTSILQSGAVRKSCLQAIDGLLKDWVSAAPSGWCKDLDYQLLAKVIEAISCSRVAEGLEKPDAKDGDVLETLRLCCAKAQERQHQEGHRPL